jgi:hypothetical protein
VSQKPLKFTPRALTALAERTIEKRWAEDAMLYPDWVEPDSSPERKRAFKAIPLAENRILRVVYAEQDDEIRIITVFFDRDAKKP